MPKNYEAIGSDNITTTRTLLHEVLPLTGTIVSGTYGAWRAERNVKNYTHGMFQSVYDYPYLSSSANHIFDLTVGYDETSELSASTSVQNSKKINMYNQYAQVLLGYTSSNGDGIRKFESDLTLDNSGVMREGFFISLSRLLTKDQIKKGSFSITLGAGTWATPYTKQLTLQDKSASVVDTQVATSDGGDYGVLYDITGSKAIQGHGVIFYQAGIVFISSSVFLSASLSQSQFNNPHQGTTKMWNAQASLRSGSISSSCDALRHRIKNISFNNTTEINSNIYFCRVPHNKFNYSSNPTYLTGSKIRVKNRASDNPVAYVTTVGLYNAANELLAVAKLSEPLKKSVDNELTIRVRLDY